MTITTWYISWYISCICELLLLSVEDGEESTVTAIGNYTSIHVKIK
jgi:hypothetical protein